MLTSIRFVRLFRATNMKRGRAVDKAGKRWRGFQATQTPEAIEHTAILGDVGICFVCRGRVFAGWECLDDDRDVCDNCVVLPPPERIVEVDPNISKTKWRKLEKEFYRASSHH